MTNDRGNVMYVGVTNNLLRRVEEHRSGKGSVFTTKYKVTVLVHFEQGTDIHGALSREKEIKSWRRQKKDDLVVKSNPEWQDLYPALRGA